MKRVFWLLVLIAMIYLGYRLYQGHRDTLQAESGDFTCQGCDSPEEHARFLKENAGESLDGDSERKINSARAAAEKAAAGEDEGLDSAATKSGSSTGASSMTAPEPSRVSLPGTSLPGTSTPATSTLEGGNPPVILSTNGQPNAAPPNLPTRDTEAPNAPNGARFAGSGSYEWYRQGNITWRIDTNTGRSCIIYATMEEWHKQIVMSHGCGRDA